MRAEGALAPDGVWPGVALWSHQCAIVQPCMACAQDNGPASKRKLQVEQTMLIGSFDSD
jgi:hypothetical protein